jgi:D-glycero-D-manno-heptose 1,7-bisphosphate phosphatase
VRERGVRPAVFLDKDGTLIVNVPYNADPALVRFTPGALDGVQRLHAAGWPIVIVTNQSGLATGRFDLAQYRQLQRAVRDRLRDEAGVELTGWYTCPHARADPPACACRKPQAGLLRQAAGEHGLDLARSWMVGDILDDVEAGRRAGCRTVLLDVGHESEWRHAPEREPHHRCADLREVADVILADGAAAR